MSFINTSKFIVLSRNHIANINRALKDINSNIIADYICADQHSLTITTNKVTSLSDLSVIKKYIKNVDVINSDDVMLP